MTWNDQRFTFCTNCAHLHAEKSKDQPLEIKDTENIPRVGQIPDQGPPLEIKDTENIPRVGQIPQQRKLDPEDIQIGQFCPNCMTWNDRDYPHCSKCGQMLDDISEKPMGFDELQRDQDKINPKFQRRAGHEQPLEIKDTENIPRVGQIPDQDQPSIPNPADFDSSLIHVIKDQEEQPLEIKDTENIPRVGQVPGERKLDPEDVQIGQYCPNCMTWNPIENQYCIKCGQPFREPETKTTPPAKPASLDDKPWGTFVPTPQTAQPETHSKPNLGVLLILERWLPVLIGLSLGIWLSITNLISIPFPLGRMPSSSPPQVAVSDPTPTQKKTERTYSGDTSSQTEPTNTSVPVLSNTNSTSGSDNQTENVCGVFDNLEILKTVMMPMRNCNPRLHYYYKLDSPIPGLASPSSQDLEYYVEFRDLNGECYLDDRFEDRLYCKLDISPSDAYSVRTFNLFVAGCDSPINRQDLTVPVLEGCGVTQSDPEPEEIHCTTDEIISGIEDEATCTSLGHTWKMVDAYYRCVCTP